ncbi:MAG: hypothetical protein WC332_05405 [Clostridia bacterium]|jgi:hypothetical protein
MNKKILFLFLIISFALALNAKAFTTSSNGYINNGVNPENYIVNTDNNLILDISLPDPATDTVLAGSGTPTAGSAVITTNPWSGAAVPVFFYDNGNAVWAAANDGIFTDDDSSGTYSIGDTQLAGTGTPVIGSAIITTNPWASASLPIFFYDDSDAVWTSGNDGIFLDIDGSGYYNADKIYSVYVFNAATDGPAADNEIDTIKIWQENGNMAGHQTGDTLIGSKTSAPYWNQTIVCSSSAVYTSTSKDRIYVTVDISPKAINKRTIKGGIAQNGLIFVSTSDGPTDSGIVNANIQTILTSTAIDQIKPTSSIDAITTSIIPGQTYTVTGVCADTGGSSVKEVKLSLNGGITWVDTTPLIAQNNGYTWKYIWSDIAAGAYTLKTRAADWIGNIEIPGEGIVIIVSSQTATSTIETSTSTTTSTTEIATSTSTSTTENTTEQLIMTLQLKLIELLKQLIELLKARL